MTEPEALKPAPPSSRAMARGIDALLEFVTVFLVTSLAGCTAFVTTGQDFFTDEDLASFYALWAVLSVPALIFVIVYEVTATTRRGQTLGKRCMGLQVALCDGQGLLGGYWERPDPLQSFLRWVIPHGAGMLAAVVAAVVVYPRVQGPGAFWGSVAGAAVAPWALVYASSLWGKDGRGWHDKAAGTVVVEEPEPPARPKQPAREPGSGSTSSAAQEGSGQPWGLVSDYYSTGRPRSADRGVSKGSPDTDP